MRKKLTALIDGDIYIFRAALAAEEACQWDDDLWTLHASMYKAQDVFHATLEEIQDAVKADETILALSDTRNFRYDIYPEYKSNRKDKRPPLLRGALKEWVQQEYKTYLRPNLEGDDVLGILATSPYIIKGDKVIVSEDKDMNTVPTSIFMLRTGEIREVSELEADYYHMTQTLTGDITDGYVGCKGVGAVGAKKLLEGMLDGTKTRHEVWQTVVKAYEKAGLSEEFAITQAQVARICRRNDYDFKTKQVKLWQPPQG